MSGEYLTEEKIAYMQKYLKENPIDPKWDEDCEMFDDRYPAFRGEDDVPFSQELARAYQLMLKELSDAAHTRSSVIDEIKPLSQ